MTVTVDINVFAYFRDVTASWSRKAGESLRREPGFPTTCRRKLMSPASFARSRQRDSRSSAETSEILESTPLLQREDTDERTRIARAYEILYSRPPAAAETDLGLAFLADASSGEPAARWASYAQVLLSAHEFRQIQ